jgi:hypothetical protein
MQSKPTQSTRSKQPLQTQPESLCFERHYKPAELAKVWGFSTNLIRRWFREEPDVLLEGHAEELHRQKYLSMRIPATVAERVYREHLQMNRRAA